jgi:hypothetical protein
MIMLRPMPGDLILFARALSVCPTEQMPDTARQLLAEATMADRYRRAVGKAHPTLGDGSLVGRIMREDLPVLTRADTPEFLIALRIVAETVLNHTVT